MSSKERVVPEEMACVIIYDADGGMYFLQQKDCTYWMEPFRHKYNFFGTGLVPARREKPFDALKRKLAKEMPDAEEKITSEMRFWKQFRLPWGASIEGEYICHVYVMIMTSKYEMMDLIDMAGKSGEKRGSLVYTDRIPQMTAQKDFMGSLHIVAKKFMEEIKIDPTLFWDKLHGI